MVKHSARGGEIARFESRHTYLFTKKVKYPYL